MRGWNVWSLILLAYIGLCIGSCLGGSGCAKPIPGPQGTPGTSCKVVHYRDVDVVTCTDGTTADIKPGAQGVPGVAGESCTQAQVSPSGVADDPAAFGGSLISCGTTQVLITNGRPGIDGQAGLNGQDGAVGAAGPQGPQGTPGLNGEAATTVTGVLFCQAPTVYPTSFPEYGFCIDGTLFAVYWSGRNAWMAEIPPGYYASTSETNPCNFTVGSNCEVTHD